MRSEIKESYIGGFLNISLNRLSTYTPKPRSAVKGQVVKIRGQDQRSKVKWSRSLVKIKDQKNEIKDQRWNPHGRLPLHGLPCHRLQESLEGRDVLQGVLRVHVHQTAAQLQSKYKSVEVIKWWSSMLTSESNQKPKTSTDTKLEFSIWSLVIISDGC